MSPRLSAGFILADGSFRSVATWVVPPLVDAVLIVAYAAMAVALWRLARTRRMIFPAVFVLFGAFLVANVFARVLAMSFAGQPDHWLVNAANWLTVGISLAAMAVLLRAVPAVLKLPTRAELEQRVNARSDDLTAANTQLRVEIGQRQEAEAEVRRLNGELHARLAEVQSLFKLLPVGVAIATDASCRRIRCNQAFADMIGLPINQDVSLSGPPFEMPENIRVMHETRELRPEELPMQRAVAANTRIRDFEAKVVRADGVTLEILANAVPIRDLEGKPRGCVATFQDISAHKDVERRRLDFERKLLHSQKLESIGVLAGGIAHDFNNLLTGVLGHANFARAELARGVTTIDPMLAQVENSAHRAAELCSQLLAYAGKGRFVVRLIDVNVAVQQAVPLLNLSVTKKVTLNLQLGTALPPFRGDPTQIHQVLINLVTNASEAVGPGAGSVTIRTDRVNLTPMDMLTLTCAPDVEPGPFVSLEVKDTGCGIPPETLAHIFEPFFTTKFVGRGLGLAAVMGIVQGHHGAVRVSSQVGAGTTFELFFPVVATSARDTMPSFTTSPVSRGTVLAVDDDETIRAFAQHVLTKAGYTVVTATDGEDALQTLRQDPLRFDVVLLDLTMPKLDGEDTLMALRMMAPNLPVILTSGYSEQTIAQRFVGRGMADFLPKPFVSEALVSAIGAALARVRGQN